MDLKKLLTDGARELGVPLSAGQADAFMLYLRELRKWNQKTNLTAIEEPRDIIIKHFLDSLSLIGILPSEAKYAADIGSGAGLPGIPIKIAVPGLIITSIEPAHRKAAFQRHMIRVLGLDGIRVDEAKVEEVVAGLERFDIIFSRAFKEPERLLPLAGPILAEGGEVILSLGPSVGEVPPDGWEVARRDEVTLPFSDIKRTLSSYKKKIMTGV
jgi:16S rRNA (guanine527-N7)-methyltransferase